MTEPRQTILAIDDTEVVRRVLEESLRPWHWVKTAADGKAALALARQPPLPDLVLLDTRLAAESGYELCKALRGLPGLAELPVIFMGERRSAQDLAQAFRLDAIDFFVKPLSAPAIRAGIDGRLEQLAEERRAQLQGSQRRVARLVRAMQWHDSGLGGQRTHRLAGYARALGEAAGAREGACDLLMRAAPLHDVGKLGVPGEVLRNEPTLSGAERELFERHAALGAEIIGEHDDALLKLARTIALTHHERWDGTGYPGRLQASQIPWAGRVMALVDAFESMTAPHYHGSAISIEQAVDEIGTAAGKQFDPALVEAFRKAVPALRRVYETHAPRPTDDDFVIGAAADAARPAAAPAEDDFVIGEPVQPRPVAADAGGPPAAPADEDLVIGTAVSKEHETAEAAATNAPRPPAAPGGDDIVIGTAGSAERGAQAASDLDGTRARIAGLENERAAAVAALSQARAELADLQRAHRAEAQAQSELLGQVETLRARVNGIETERAAAVAALSQARAELADLQRTHRVEALGELDRVRHERDAAEQRHRREQSELHRQLEAERAATAKAQGELDRIRREENAPEQRHRREQSELHGQLESLLARINELEAERAAAATALSEARGELADLQRAHRVQAQAESGLLGQVETLRARVSELEAELADVRRTHKVEDAAEQRNRREQSELHGQLESLRARINELEAERAAAAAALSEARGELADVQRAHRVQAQAESGLLGLEAELADVRRTHRVEDAAEQRNRREQSELHEQLESLHARANELEAERAAAATALSEARGELADLQERLETWRQRVTALETERAAGEDRHAQERDRVQAQVEELRARLREAEDERAAAQARHEAALAELERRRVAAESALAQVGPPTTATGSHPIVLLVVFLLGGLAVAVTFVLALYYLQVG